MTPQEALCRDPSGTMIAFGDMMRKQIVMPAHLMNDNEHTENNNNSRNLFKDFSSVAQATGTYTGQVQTLPKPHDAKCASCPTMLDSRSVQLHEIADQPPALVALLAGARLVQTIAGAVTAAG